MERENIVPAENSAKTREQVIVTMIYGQSPFPCKKWKQKTLRER